MQRNSRTKLNAVIGYPLTHSKSPQLHQQFYQRLGLNAVIMAFSSPKLKPLVAAIRILPIHLTAVTMPFKQSILPFLDSVSPEARAVGAVNTVVNKNGKLHGHNTDVYGISYALRGCNLRGKKILLIGAGGAARAAALAASRQKARLMYLNRTPEKAAELEKKFGGRTVKPEELKAKNVDIVINATPVGMHPKISALPISQKLIAPHQTVFDLVYNPPQTRLLKFAKRKGAKTISGLDMFAAQGARQIEIWTHKRFINAKLLKSASDFAKTGMA